MAGPPDDTADACEITVPAVTEGGGGPTMPEFCGGAIIQIALRVSLQIKSECRNLPVLQLQGGSTGQTVGFVDFDDLVAPLSAQFC